MNFQRSRLDEEEADKKALELLANSPYKDKLGNAGLFLKALQDEPRTCSNLIRRPLGDGLVSGKTLRMSALLNSAPQLDERKKDQIAALAAGWPHQGRSVEQPGRTGEDQAGRAALGARKDAIRSHAILSVPDSDSELGRRKGRVHRSGASS